MVDGSIRIDTKIDQSGVDKGLAGIEKSCSSFSMSMSSAFALAAAAGSALVTGALFSLNKSMLETASNANEMASRFASTFPDSIDAANTAVQELTTSYGFSTLAAQSSLSATGGLLATLGMTEKESLAASRGVAVLGADLASYTNYSGGAAGAADALTRALLGETEAAKGLSLSIGDDALAAYGRSLGKSVAAMNTAQKAQLRLNLAFSQASAMGAVGDMIKTANGYANTIRAVTSKLEDAEARAGEKLIPVVSDLAREFGNAVSPGGVFAGMLDTVAEAGAQTTGVLTVLLAGLNSAARASSQVSGRKELQIQELMLGAVEARIAAEGGLAAVQARAVKDAGAAQTIKEYNTFTDSVKNLKAELKDLDAQEKAAKRGEVMQSAAMYQEKLLEAQRRMAEAQALLTRTDIPEMGREAAQKTYDQNLADYKLYWSKLSEMLQREGVSVAEAYAAATPTVKKTVLPPTGAGADEKTAANLHALWQEYYNWKVGEEEGSLAQEIQLSEAAYKKKIADAQLSYEDLEVIADMHESEIAKIREKWAKKHEIASFLMGFGMTEKTAEGMESGVFSIVSATKDIGEAIADTFETIGEIFDFGASVLGWIVDFNYADTESAITKYTTAIGDFFKNKLGALSVLFDVGAAAVEQLLAGLMASLPAIVASIGNLVQHIVDYIVNNGPALISKIITIVSALVQVVAEKMPALASVLAAGFLQLLTGVVSMLPAVVRGLVDSVSAVLAQVIQAAPALIDAIVAALLYAFSYVAHNAGTIISQLVTLAFKVVEGVVRNLPSIVQDALGALPVLISGILKDILPTFLDDLPGIIQALLTAVVNMIPVVVESLPDILAASIGQIIAGVLVYLPVALIKAAPAIVWAILKALVLLPVQLYRSFAKMAENAWKGFVEGFNKAGDLWSAVKRVFTRFVDAIKDFFGIHSPSRLFFSMGLDIIRGLINGILSMGSSLFSAGLSIVSSLMSGLLSVAGSIGSALGGALKSAAAGAVSAVSDFFNLGAQLGGAIMSGIENALSDLGSLLSDSVSSAVSGVGSVAGSATGAAGGVVKTVSTTTKHIGRKIKHAFASGTSSAPGGWSVVGEKGPELMNLKAGSTILSASDSIRAVMAALAPRTAGGGAAQSISISGDIAAADVVIDGATIGKIAFRYIDKQVKAAYGA